MNSEILHVKDDNENDACIQPGAPHEAMFFVLAYLPVFELLSMSLVCKSLRDAIRNDVLPWLNIIVERPLNTRLSDDILMKLTSKANGRLRMLSLMKCTKISDDGLLRVVAENPNIGKLYVPACTSLTPEGVIQAVKSLTRGSHRVKGLKIGGIYNLKKEDLLTLRDLISFNSPNQRHQKILYREYKKSSTVKHKETNSPIDVDICPKCNEVRMVFDCPQVSCERKKQYRVVECRGCDLCVPRCEECGICLTGQELEDAACADTLCSECWLSLPKCNFCNKPYCSQHADLRFSDTSGFICSTCHEKFC